MTPGVARRKAEGVSPEKWQEAQSKAMQTARVVINRVSRKVIDERDFEPVEETFDRVNGEIRREIVDGHTLHRHHIEARQIGALTEGVWATINVVYEERRVKPGFSLDIEAAVKKQKAYNEAASVKSGNTLADKLFSRVTPPGSIE